MKKLLLSIIASVFVFSVPVQAASIIPETPITYSDARPSASWRLPAADDGVILTHGNAPGGTDIKGARDSFIYEENGTYYMTYDGADNNYWGSNMTTSTDLVNWTSPVRKLSHGAAGASDSASAAYSTIYKDASTYYMFYLGAKVKAGQPTNTPFPPYVTKLAKSSSLTGTWTKYPNEPIPLVNGSYREVTVSPGTIIKQGTNYYMYFSAAAEHLGKYYRGIGLAWTTNLNSGTWSVGSGAIIPIYEQVENASVFYQQEDNTWYMFVNHVGIDSSGNETTDSVWVYWSSNPFDWDANNRAVVIDSSVSNWSNDNVIGIPSVIKKDGQLKISYDGRSTLDPVNINNNIGRDIALSHVELPIVKP